MADFQRQAQRFFFAGISASPSDALAPGKIPYARNVRSYEDGVIQVRDGFISKISAALPSAIHTIARLNDATTFNGGVPSVRVLGAGAILYRGATSGTTYVSLDSGYSGQPLSTLAAQPPQSPRPYLYVADPLRMRKFTTDGSALQIGLSQPRLLSDAPSVALAQLSSRIVVPSDYAASGGAATAPTTAQRVTTTISQIVYDTGAAPGYASVVPTSFAGITEGMLLAIGGETAIVTELTIAVASTTIAKVIYDSGTTGLCTIQPAGSLGTGQLEAPSLAAYRRRAQLQTGTRFAIGRGDNAQFVPLDPEAPVRRIRQMDFPVNCLILLNGTQTVRILSVAVGPDGLLSFRCSTPSTVSAGQTIAGKASFRVYLTGSRLPGQAITNAVKTNQLRYPLLPTTDAADAPTTTQMTGGLMGHAVVSLAQFSDGRAILPDDVIHVALRVDRLPEVTAVRVFFALTDNDFLANSFLENYFVYEWRPSDIIASIQTTNAADVSPLSLSRETVVANEQLNPDNVVAVLGGLITGATGGLIGGSTGVTDAQHQENIRRRTGINATSPGSAATTKELALGNSQWMDLRCRVSDLIRVGTDTTKTLADVRAFQVLVSAAAAGRIGNTSVAVPPLTVAYGDIFVAGGAGPDVGEVGDPYVYAYRYRSSATGAVSNPSPANRGGVIPKRQKVLLTPVASSDPQVDKIDWFRLGGTLTQFTYVGTGSNTSVAYEDTVTDAAIDGGEILRYDNFQPWATQDLPKTAVVDVAGTAIKRVSGTTFNTAWAPGSAVIVNGRAVTLYASPSSGDLMHVVESVPEGTSVPCAVPGATKLSQPLQSLWGDFQGVVFGCGDPDNPGTLYWSHGNNIEQCRDADTLLVAPPSEPLQAGFIYNTFAGVFSTEELYQILPNSGTVSRFRVVRTPCGRGLWTPWAFCVAPEGIYFLTGDGIYLTAGGSPAISVTDGDLRPIFPNDGVPGATTNGIPAPDMTQFFLLRLAYVAGYVYFDYYAVDGTFQTLIFDTKRKAWMLDSSAKTGIWARAEEPGARVFDQMLGGYDGGLYQYDEDARSDAGTPIAWAVTTPMVDGGQPRVTKQFGDAALSANPHGSTLGISVGTVVNDGSLLANVTVGVGDANRFTYVIDLPAGGFVARNFGLVLQGATVDGDPGAPELFLWEPSFLFKGDSIAQRATDWDTLGYVGAKFVQGLILTANTYGIDKTILIQRDGSEDIIELTINHDGEETKEYPQASQSLPGWPPFIAHQVRIVGADTVPWQILGYRFVWEPHPELATQWETQFTSHDSPGYLTVRDCVIAHASDGDIRLRIRYDDGATTTYTIPASGGTDPINYTRSYVVVQAGKGKAVEYQLRSGCPFRLFKRDCSVRVWQWGSQGGYLQTMPFGGPHRADGAAI